MAQRKRKKTKIRTVTDSAARNAATLSDGCNPELVNGDNKADANERDGYVYGQTIRGADAEFKTWVLSDGYKTDVIDDDGESITFKHKSRIYPKELHVNVTKPGSKKPAKKSVIVDQKQMVYYSEKYAKKQRADREAMIARANDLIKYPKKYDRVTAFPDSIIAPEKDNPNCLPSILSVYSSFGL